MSTFEATKEKLLQLLNLAARVELTEHLARIAKDKVSELENTSASLDAENLELRRLKETRLQLSRSEAGEDKNGLSLSGSEGALLTTNSFLKELNQGEDTEALDDTTLHDEEIKQIDEETDDNETSKRTKPNTPPKATHS